MSETDDQFLSRMSFTEPEEGMRERDFDRLFALARRGAALDAVLDAASDAISHVARFNSPERIIEARAMVLRAALPPPPAGETNE